jgi:hypothetical protein
VVVLARGVVRGLLRLGLPEVKGRRVGLGAAGVVGRIKAAAAAVVVEVRGLLRIRARVPRMATVPSMVVRKRRRLAEVGKGRRRREQQRWTEEEKWTISTTCSMFPCSERACLCVWVGVGF